MKAVIATSAKQDELKEYTRVAGIDDLVGDATASDDADRSKPHPDTFQAALGKLDGVLAGEALALGDTPYDAEAVGMVGIRTVGVFCGGFPESELRRAGCVAIYRDPADLMAHFDSSPLALRLTNR